MDIALFDFELPERLIAQHPLSDRDQSRLFVYDRTNGTAEHRRFHDIVEYLAPGDVLVRNDTKVVPARLFGHKPDTGAHVEILILKPLEDGVYECLVGNAKTVKPGTRIVFGPELAATCVQTFKEGIRWLKFSYQGVFMEILERIGHMPLPPYIHERLLDADRYQTVYARMLGSAAGPTAGFHFTPTLIEKIKTKGVTIVDVTLHIGLATFRPVKVKDTAEHKMHHEEYEIGETEAAILNQAKAEGRRIIAVGTTSTRALEANFGKYGRFQATKEATDIFIYPGVPFQAIDAIVTNFHLPKSTLIMMISAFVGLDTIKRLYHEAIALEYRFFSFGDAMFIYGK